MNLPNKVPKTFTVKDPSSSTERQASEDEYKKTHKEADNLFKDYMKDAKEEGVKINEYGHVTVDKKEKGEQVSYNELTDTQVKELNKSLKNKATDEAKKIIFPDMDF